MIPDCWYAVCESRTLRRRPLGLRRLGERLVLWRRADGTPVVMRDRCPHKGAALSLGRVEGDAIACPYHGFRFEGGAGRCTLMPCEGRGAKIPAGMQAAVLPVREQHGLLWVWHGEPRTELPPVPWFDELPRGLACAASGAVTWPLHYARLVETNFDLHHFPFVHRSLGGFKIGARLDPNEVEVGEDWIRCRAVLRHEEQPPERGLPVRVELRLPNLVWLALTPKLHLVAIASPVDAQSTWLWARYYQQYTSLPGIGKLVAKLALELDWKLAQNRQDLPILRSLDPPTTGPGVNRFVGADRASAAYVKLREHRLRGCTSTPRPVTPA